MKVLIVATVVKTHIMQFHIPTIKMLQDMGWTVDVAAKNDYPDGEECNIPYVDNYYDIDFCRNPFSVSNLKAYKNLKSIIDRGGYDVVHCHTPVGGIVGRLAAAGARKSGTKVFYTAHGFHFYKGAPLINWLLYFPAEWICSFMTDRLVTITLEDHQRACRHLHAVSTEYIPGIGIDTGRFGGSADIRKKAREKYGIADNETLLLSVGELNENKNHIAAVKAIKKLNDPHIRYWIVGNDLMDGYLKKKISGMGLDSQVILPGYRNDLPEIYMAADIYVHTSFREGMSVALMEAMASGLPAVCSDIRGNCELIDEGLGGRRFDPSDEGQLAEYLSELISDRKKRKEYGEYNRQKIRVYDQSVVLGKLRTFYESI